MVEKRILNLLSRQLMSTSQVAKRINMRREVTSGYLEALMHQGKLEKTIVGKSNVYRTIARKRSIELQRRKKKLENIYSEEVGKYI